MAFSPGNTETLQFPPVHNNAMSSLQDDLKSLRRSMSRSPSRITRTHKSPLDSPTSASRRSPLSHQLHTPDASKDTTTPQSARKLRPSLARSSVVKGGLFASTRVDSPRSQPTRRPLSTASDFSINCSQSSQESGEGQENQATTPNGSPPDSHIFTISRSKTPSSPFRLTNGRPKSIASTDRELLKEWAPAKSSPLKRNDGLMNLDQPSFGSPSAKRRSLHGVSFDVARDEDPMQKSSGYSEDEPSFDDPPVRSALAPRQGGGPRRPHANLRLSDRMSIARNRRSLEFDPGSSFRRTNPKLKPRTSLDVDTAIRHENVELEQATSPDSRQQAIRGSRQFPHPLSQALTPSSPIQPSLEHGRMSTQRPLHRTDEISAFSKSLPIGALRPHHPEQESRSSKAPLPTIPTFATPKSFAAAKPDPAAFRSTGLISKRYRNPDDMPPPPGGHGAMPDTPCKKPPAGIGFDPSPTPVTSIAKPRLAQPLFGTPTKPVSLPMRHTPDSTNSAAGNPMGGSEQTQLNRSTSFISNDDSDCGRSPKSSNGHGESQSSADELPPTPTKQTFGFMNMKTSSKNNSLRSTLFNRRASASPKIFTAPVSNEQSTFVSASSGQTYHDALALQTVTPVPHTPAEAGFPDPSQLSISPSNRGIRTPSWRSSSRFVATQPPVTPSTSHEEAQTFVLPGALATPSHRTNAGHDIDAALSARFEKVIWYSRGQFSEVYKVEGEREGMVSKSDFTSSNCKRGVRFLPAPASKTVFIVKKSKVPHFGSKARQRKVREVAVMQSIGRNDHIVQLIDSWEANQHLYLQLEFCEEGSLDSFLARQGRTGRLDDFRIWKILLEVAAGIKHIHDSGFLHLDIKPENIFIDFSGALKIGDFGLACGWPAPKSIEGEGDRRYIGPDLLLGQFDKPADIFAFGMMMYEIAANCVPPDNGTNWQKLRSGDFDGLPDLTCSSSYNLTHATTDTLGSSHSADTSIGPASPNTIYSSRPEFDRMEASGADFDKRLTCTEDSNVSRLSKPVLANSSATTELAIPPIFMVNSENSDSLDTIVHWMMRPEPEDRPVIQQLLDATPCRWVASRRRAGAVVWEGKWGPSNTLLMPDSTDSSLSGNTPVVGGNTRDYVERAGHGTFFDDADVEMMDA